MTKLKLLLLLTDAVNFSKPTALNIFSRHIKSGLGPNCILISFSWFASFDLGSFYIASQLKELLANQVQCCD